MLTIEEQHQKMLYTQVRVRAPTDKGTAIGSGTIVYSELVPDGDSDGGTEYETYVLTNHHVVEGQIKYKEDFDPLLQRNKKKDIRGTVDVDVFEFDFWSRATGGTSYKADIMAYDKEQDLALLRIRRRQKFDYIANLLPLGKEMELRVFQPVWNVGCGLGQHAFPSPPGYISQFGSEIDNMEFILISSPSIFGNSGGATFLADTGEFIGIPSRIAVVPIGWSADPITHMNFSIPVWRIYEFLKEQIFHFIFDDSVTSKDCKEEREHILEADRLNLYRKDIQEGQKKVVTQAGEPRRYY